MTSLLHGDRLHLEQASKQEWSGSNKRPGREIVLEICSIDFVERTVKRPVRTSVENGPIAIKEESGLFLWIGRSLQRLHRRRRGSLENLASRYHFPSHHCVRSRSVSVPRELLLQVVKPFKHNRQSWLSGLLRTHDGCNETLSVGSHVSNGPGRGEVEEFSWD